MIKTQDLAFSYTNKPFIENINFEVATGEIFGFQALLVREKVLCRKY